jgi:hypothetical protein
MRVFKIADGTSWVAHLHDGDEAKPTAERVGWEAILFISDPATVAQRLVYRPVGWLSQATTAELAAALEEGEVVRARWGETG